MEKKHSAYVAVEAATYAIDKPYEYLIPEALSEKVAPGVRVRVTFGKGRRKTDGIVLEVRSPSEESGLKLKPIEDVIDETPVLDEGMIKLALRIREMCFCTFFDAAKAMLPGGVWHKSHTVYLPTEKILEEADEKELCEFENGRDIYGFISDSSKPSKKADLEQLYGKTNTDRVVSWLLKSGYISESEKFLQKISDKTERLVRLDVSKEEAERYIARKKPRIQVQETLSMLFDLGAAMSRELCYFTGITTAQLSTLKKNGIVSFEEVEVYRRPRPETYAKQKKTELNSVQKKAFSEIREKLDKGPSCALLYGVTGSGKTLVYFKLIEEVIKRGKNAILLVPEISLTPQLLAKVYGYFGERTAVMHSALSQGERYDEWKRIKNGEVDVVVGTRSAIFSPLSDIGIIIIDEEQEDTYKSSSNPRYHARDVAKFRCVSDNALLLLGSATPSVESMYFAKNGKYSLHTLPVRFNDKPLPRVIISDLRKNLREGSDSIIGCELYAELEKNIENGEQSILFLNRRGASKYMLCDECGEVPGCPNCSVPLVYHSKNKRLMCHHCGYSSRAEKECSVCGADMRFVGFGTQRVEEELKALFPDVGIIRMDMDTTSQKASHEKLLNKFRDEKTDILLGTQMITKGLDFENVTLVGVLSADQAICNEGYKTSENAFSLVTQVVGRAGRGNREGRAVIQTYMPKNFIIQAASKQDYDGFYENEIQLREIRGFPPFSDVFSLTVIADDEVRAYNACRNLSETARYALENEYEKLFARVLGPTPAGIVKVNGKFRYRLLICMKNGRLARELISRLIRDFMKDKKNKDISIIPDINTTDF